MTSVLDINKVKNEIRDFIRNNDIFTITQRSVTTGSDTGTFSGVTTHLINVNNVKNIRSIIVGGNTLSFGTDYTYELDYDDSGNIKCKITFITSQTGAYSISYDYGSDSIFSDMPRNDLSINSFPRISIYMIGESTQEIELSASSQRVDFSFAVNIYSTNNEDLADYVTSIKTLFIQNKDTFYYLKFVGKRNVSPVTIWREGKQKVLQQNVDYYSTFNIEDS